MSVHSRLFQVAGLHHDALIALLHDLEAAEKRAGRTLPADAIRLQGAIWPFLQAYGRRDHRGSVDEDVVPPLKPWRPGDDGGDAA